MRTRRRQLSALRSGLGRARASLGIVRAHPRMLVVPAAAVVAGVVAFLPLLVAVRAGARWLLTAAPALGVDAVAAYPVVAYLSAWAFLSVYAAVLLFAGAALVHCTRQVVDGEPVSLTAAARATARVAPQVLAFAAVLGAVGVALAAVERTSDWVGDLVASVLGASVAVTTFFVVPAAVLDGAGLVEAVRLSVETVRRSFGETAVLSLGVVSATVTAFAVPWMVAVLAVPFVGAERMSALVEADPLLYGGVPALSLWVGLVAGVSLGAVAKTGLYLAVRDGRESVPLLGVPVDEAAETPA